jgi:glycosyltransferase involved in cell wall biosynthesis
MSKVVLLTHEFYPKKGGAGIYCEEIAKAGQIDGCQVEVWASEVGGSLPKEWQFGFHSLSYRGSQGLWARYQLRRNILKNVAHLKGCVLHIAEPGAMITFLTFTKLIERIDYDQLILTFHGTEILKFSSSHFQALKNLVGRSDRITVLSPYVRNLLLDNFPESEEKIRITPGAPRFYPVLDDKKKRDREQITIISVARLHPRKGQAELIKAISLLGAEKQKKIRLQFVGQRVHETYAKLLEKQAEELSADVDFLDNVSDDELKVLLQKADIFAMTSMPSGKSVEGLGLSYLEASAYGLPILAHDIGGVRYAVIDGETGLLADAGNTQNLADKLSLLIEDEFKRDEMGRAGRLFVEKFSWTESARLTYGK